MSYIDDTGNYASPDINRLIDGSGLSDPIGATITTSELAAITVSGDIDGTGWRRNGQNAPNLTFTFTLQDPSVVSGILPANYWENGWANRGLSTFSFQYSTDNGDNYTTLTTINPSQSTGGFEYIDLGSTLTDVTNIRFSNATYFSNDNSQQIAGLNEVRFVNAVPETSTALLGGLGVLALLRRRRA